MASSAVRVVPVPDSVEKRVSKNERVRAEHKGGIERTRQAFVREKCVEMTGKDVDSTVVV